MERFSYPSIAAVLAESAELLQLLEAESYGYKKDQEERLLAQQADLDLQRQNIG